MKLEDEEEVRIAIENNEYVANSYVEELLEELDNLRAFVKHQESVIAHMTNNPKQTSTYISTDSETYNAGRSEGNADVAAEIRKIIDPEDKNHFNLQGALKEVEDLVRFKNQAVELLDIIRQADALKEFAYERGDDDLSIREQLTLLLGRF